MNKNINIRQATVEDLPIVAKFYKTAFNNAQFKYTERFPWLYQYNPFFTNNRFLPIWIALDQEKILGMSCLMPQNYLVKQHSISGAVAHDFRFLPECRGMGLGTQLQKLKLKNGNLLYIDPSEAVVHIQKKIGFLSKYSVVIYLNARGFNPKSLFDDLCRYIRITHYSKLYNIGLSIKIPEILSKIMLILFKAKQNWSQISKHGETSLIFKSVNFFPEQVDELWDEIKAHYSFAVFRNSKYLNWKFVSQPHLSYQRYLVYKGSKLCGILIFRCGHAPELPIGTISEFYTNQGPEILRQMVNFAVKKLYQQGSLMIQCASSTAERSKVLSSIGFIPERKNLSTFLFSPDKDCDFADIAVKGDWLMGFGDGDFDAYGRASHPSLGALLKILFRRTPKNGLIKS